MRAVVQRVNYGRVTIEDRVTADIGSGLVILLGVGPGDDEQKSAALAKKIAQLRIMEDVEGKMNLSLKDAGGRILAVSQFTLMGDLRGGRRPSFIEAARPEIANPLYEEVVRRIREGGVTVETGIFQAEMAVSLVNDGPVTILLDSRKTF